MRMKLPFSLDASRFASLLAAIPLRVAAPFALLSLGLLGVMMLAVLRPAPDSRPPRALGPLVEVMTVQSETVAFTVRTQGAVTPRTESDLVPQVAGEVVQVSPALVSGGFFEAGEVLLRIDQADYDAAARRAEAVLARAQSEAERAARQWQRQRRLAEQDIASEARIDDAGNAHRVAQAALREAEVALENALRDLARTELRAPYAGRVRSEQVDLGQFVKRGDRVARIYAVDYAEVRLPVPDRELGYLDVPLSYRPPGATSAAAARPAAPAGAGESSADSAGPGAGESAANPAAPQAAADKTSEHGAAPGKSASTAAPHASAPFADDALGPGVRLRARFAGREHAWRGRIVRTEGEIDPKSRMVTLVARVEDPYGAHESRPPLAVGLFVRAEIEGAEVEGAFVLPRTAMQEENRVLVLQGERLYFREVEVLRTEAERVVVAAGGLAHGERVCITPLARAVDGMQVRVAEAADAADASTQTSPSTQSSPTSPTSPPPTQTMPTSPTSPAPPTQMSPPPALTPTQTQTRTQTSPTSSSSTPTPPPALGENEGGV